VRGPPKLNKILPTFSKPLFYLYVGCSLLAIFYLPHLVPLPPSVSPSYIFGYNNQAGIVLLLLFVGLGVLWTKGLNLQFQPKGNSPLVPKSTLAATLVAVLAGCSFMWAMAGQVGGFGESGYAIDRLLLLAHGKVPYVDFEFAYGPGLLYGPVLLQHLLSITLLHAYYLFWTLNCLLGTILLYAIVNMINYPTPRRKVIFLLLWFAGFFSSVFTMGTSGTYLRFTCPLFFVLAVDKVYRRPGPYAKFYAAILAVGFTIALLFLSPETAIAHAFACACIFVLYSGPRSIRSLALPAGLVVALALVFWFALKLPMMDTLKANRGGADSLPITFAPHILLFFAAFFVCACYLFRRYLDPQLNDNTVVLIAYSIPMVAAALGRCDPAHVLLDEQGVYLACLFYASNCKASWKWSRNAFVAISIVLAILIGLWFSLPSIASLGMSILRNSDSNSLPGRALNLAGEKYIADFAPPAKKDRWETRFADLRRSAMPKIIDLDSIYPSWHGRFRAPFGYVPNGFGTYFSDRIDYGHFDSFINARTGASVDRKIAEIEEPPQEALLVPEYFQAYCKEDVPSVRKIGILNAFPYFGRQAHQANLYQPLCDSVVAHYRMETPPDQQNFGYGLWVRRSTMAP